MEMKVVASSNIAAVGYGDGILCIRFKSGTEHNFVDVPAEKVGLLMTAKSIGGYFAAEIKPRYRSYLAKHSADYVETRKAENAPKILQTAQDDDCCKPLRSKQIASLDSWTCPKCGCEWKPTIEGAIRHWAPVESVQVFQLPAR